MKCVVITEKKGKTICLTNHMYQAGAFMLKFTPDIDFTNERVVQCDVPVVKNTFADDCINDKNKT